MSAAHIIGVLAVVALASFVQGISGFGFSLMSMPLLSAFLGVEKSLAIQTALGVLANAITATRARHDVLLPTTIRIVAATVVGMPFGWIILDHASPRTMKLIVGVSVSFMAILLARRVQLRASGTLVDAVSGFISGILSTSVGTNGPPLVIGLSGRQLPAAQQRATLSSCFMIGNIIVLIALIVAGRFDRGTTIATIAALPMVLLTTLMGDRIFNRLRQHHYDRIVVVLLIASGAIAVVSALTA